MNVALENDHLKIEVQQKGAELKSVINKHTKLEYMWRGDPAYWGKTSPILFPIVGTLKNDTYAFNGKSYQLSRHGFARDYLFETSEAIKESTVFSLVSSESLKVKYPFDFLLQLKYALVDDMLEVSYIVKNKGVDVMVFSIGGHPAFSVPLVAGSRYEDHYLQFDHNENLMRWPINQQGLVVERPTQLTQNSSTLKLSRELFAEDALVFKNLKSKRVSIKSHKHQHGIDFYFDGFPYLGIWAAKNADFVCLEPWCGIADSVLHNQQLVDKEGIIKISPDEAWSRTWKVKFY